MVTSSGNRRFSPKRGFDKLVLSTVEGLSLSGWGADFKGLFPLALNSSKGVFAFVDSPSARGLSGPPLGAVEK
jgi:hypothetical protein